VGKSLSVAARAYLGTKSYACQTSQHLQVCAVFHTQSRRELRTKLQFYSKRLLQATPDCAGGDKSQLQKPAPKIQAGQAQRETEDTRAISPSSSAAVNVFRE
jgi:hypothetical protein